MSIDSSLDRSISERARGLWLLFAAADTHGTVLDDDVAFVGEVPVVSLQLLLSDLTLAARRRLCSLWAALLPKLCIGEGGQLRGRRSTG
jgi:hypothetical protein